MLLDGKLVKSELLKELKIKYRDINTGLAVIEIGDDFASNRYIKQKEKLAKELDVKFKLIKQATATTEELVSIIDGSGTACGASISSGMGIILLPVEFLDDIEYKKVVVARLKK